MRKPFVISPLYLVLVGLFICALYTVQWPKWALRFELVPQAEWQYGVAGGDFRLFWAQGYLAAQGKPLSAYNSEDLVQTALLRNLQGVIDIRPSFYPPQFVLFTEPFGNLSYPQAWHIYNWGSVLLLAFVTVFAFRRQYYALPLLAGFGGLWSALSFGQNSIFLTALYLALAAWGARYERIGGLLLAIASFKPHMGVFAPFLLLWRRQYTTFLWAALGVVALISATIVHYSPEMWIRYLEVIHEPIDRLVNFQHVQSNYMISLYATLRGYDINPLYALAAQGALAVVAFQMLWRICRRALDPMLPVAAMVTATLLAVPHAYSYDMLLLFIPIMVIVVRAQKTGWHWADVEALVPVYALPYYVHILNQVLHLPVAPAALLLLLYRLKQHSRMDHDDQA